MKSKGEGYRYTSMHIALGLILSVAKEKGEIKGNLIVELYSYFFYDQR